MEAVIPRQGKPTPTRNTSRKHPPQDYCGCGLPKKKRSKKCERCQGRKRRRNRAREQKDAMDNVDPFLDSLLNTPDLISLADKECEHGLLPHEKGCDCGQTNLTPQKNDPQPPDRGSNLETET